MKRETIGELKLPEMDAPMHERLAEALERQVASGLYLPGDRLPTHREIARRAKVAIGTVTKAIDLLGRRGIVRGEVGRGTFVNAREPAAGGVMRPVAAAAAAAAAAGGVMRPVDAERACSRQPPGVHHLLVWSYRNVWSCRIVFIIRSFYM